MEQKTTAAPSPASAGAPASTAQAEPCPECGGCRMKHTPRSDQLKANVTRRLNRAIGQLNGVKSMVDTDRYCGDVLTQLAAAESAIKAVSRILLQDHLETCVVEQVQAGNTDVVDEVMDLFKKFAN